MIQTLIAPQVGPPQVIDVKGTYSDRFSEIVKKASKKLGVDPVKLIFFIRGQSTTLTDIGHRTVEDCDVHAGFSFKCIVADQPLPGCLSHAKKGEDGRLYIF